MAQNADALSLIAPDSIGMVSILPAQIAKSPSARLLPLEVISAAGLEYFNFDPLKLERIDAIVGMPMIGSANVPVAICITHGEALDKELLARLLPTEPITEKGVEMWSIPQTPDFVLSQRSPNQVIIGPKLQVIRLMKGSLPEGDLRRVVQSLGDDASVQVVVAFEPARDMLVGLTQFPQLQSIPDLAPNLSTVAEKARMIAMRINTSETASTSYLIEGTSPADTTKLAAAIKSLIQLAMNTSIPLLEEEIKDKPGESPKATVAYLKRMKGVIESNLNWKQDGSRLSIKVEGMSMMLAQTGTLVGLLLPAVQAARGAARRMQSSNNMKQILLAFHNYEATFGYLPSDLGPGKPEQQNKLSWRVHILPFMDQAALYEEFHLDEPWDSPHNIKLLGRMPDSYRDPRMNTIPGHTVYQMPKGPKSIHNPTTRLRFRQITDGLSNVVALLTTTEETAVPWTKPEDFDPLTNPESIGFTLGATSLGMADGSIKSILAPIPKEALEALIMISDGKPIDDSWFRQ